MRNLIAEFRDGFFVPLKGLELIFTRKRVRHAAILPFACVFLSFLIGIFFGLPALFNLVPWMAALATGLAGLAPDGVGGQTLYYLLTIITWPVVIFALLFLVFIFSQIIAAPFYALLAERALSEMGLKTESAFRLGTWLSTSLRLLAISLMKAMAFFSVGIVLFILSFIPGFGVFTAFGFLLITAYDIVDFSLEGLSMGLKERIRFCRAHFPALAGLATILGLVFLLPGLNFILFPAAIAGACTIIGPGGRSRS